MEFYVARYGSCSQPISTYLHQIDKIYTVYAYSEITVEIVKYKPVSETEFFVTYEAELAPNTLNKVFFKPIKLGKNSLKLRYLAKTPEEALNILKRQVGYLSDKYRTKAADFDKIKTMLDNESDRILEKQAGFSKRL